MWVVRLARAFTGKDKILKMEGGYHGLSDALDISVHPSPENAGTPLRPVSVPDDHGIPAGVIQDTIVAPLNDIEATREIFEENAGSLAAVIVEPLVGAGGEIPARKDYLSLLRELTAEHGVLLIFDEVISLRLAHGGAQERFSILPDLCMMGKIIGGGLPVGAFGGRKDIMAMLSPTNTYVSHSGTFSANSATMAAGLATMEELTHDVYESLEKKGIRLRDGANDIFKTLMIKGQVTGLGSCFQIHFTDLPINNYRDVPMEKDDLLVPTLLNLALLDRGIYLSRKASGFISAVNTDEEIDRFLDALGEALKEIRPVIEMEAPELIMG
jgi:glutamate-1-semialdehyde 2,1-aminomutase